MDELKDTIAKNLVELRTRSRLTQVQLASMLNYSDKAVSKWERGEAVPDLRVLIKLSEIYGVTVDDIVKRDELAPKIQPKRVINGKRAFIVAMSSGLVWFVATVMFLVFYYITPTEHYAYFCFVIAPLPTAIVCTVFSVIWGNRMTNAVTSSCIVWSAILVCHIIVKEFTDFNKIHLLYVVGAVFELLIILWFSYRWFSTRYFKNKKKPAPRKAAEKAEKKDKE